MTTWHLLSFLLGPTIKRYNPLSPNGGVLHEHCSFQDTAVTTQSIKAQDDRQDKRPSCPREPLLQANPNRFVLSPSNMTTSGGCTKRPKRPFGLPRRLISLLIPQTGTDSRQRSSTSYPTSWLFSRHLMASSIKISVATLPQRSHCLKPDASTAFRLLSRTSIAKHTRC